MSETSGVLSGFEVALAEDELTAALHISEDDREDFLAVLEQVRQTAAPKVQWRRLTIDEAGDDWVSLDGRRFGSAMVARQMTPAVGKDAIAYVATCGRELHDLARAQEDPLAEWWIDAISETVLRRAIAQIFQLMNKQLGEGITVNPGSTQGWTVAGQDDLFALLGDVPGRIGVSLTESWLMVPYKSVSGLYFPSESDYVNCMFCVIEKCPNRRAPFDPSGGMMANA